jgi:hypothetical protein
LLFACCKTDPEPEVVPESWNIVAEIEDAALLAVHGTSAQDVWLVGADDGKGPVVLQFNGTEWKRHDTGVRGDVWWVRAFDDGVVYMAGSDSIVLRYENGVFERLKTPGLGKTVLFGIWGMTSNDVYAVGANAGRNGFVWHYDGTQWTDVPLPDDIELDSFNDLPTLTKVWGTSSDDIWVVGGRGTLLRGNRQTGFTRVDTDTADLLFTVHGNRTTGRTVVVGGNNQGICLEVGTGAASDSSPDGAMLLQGVWVTPSGKAWASGGFGSVFTSEQDGPWEEVNHNLPLDIQSLHSTWVDPDGGVWSVGGNVLVGDLDKGAAIHNRAIPTIRIEPDPPASTLCPADAIDLAPGKTIARQWNEQLLNAIRRDTPRPTVHSRNLFHLSAALWDIWTSYQDTDASGFLLNEDLSGVDETDAAKAMDEAMSYAAYRILTHRYTNAIGGEVTTDCLDAFMNHLGYDLTDKSITGDSPVAFGNRVANAYIQAFAEDGANEANDYTDPEGYTPDQPRLTVDLPGSATEDPIVWQQLILAEAVTQNGIAEGSGVREYIGAHWGAVTPFAMARTAPGQPYYPMDNAPLTLNDSLVEHTMEVLQRTAWLDVDDTTMIDISPASLGNSTLGTDDGTGYDKNPVTGEAYAPIMVKRSDFGRVLAEFWADGLDSETPPGHWNTIANLLADDPDIERRLFGTGDVLDPLAWDVHVYFALNGALHDAAIAAWELKREYVTARPITLIRTLGGLGQRSDSELPSYNPKGLPLKPGLIELITEETTKKGARHEHLSRYKGELAVWSWRGEPGDRENEYGGHGWIRVKEWVSYQRRTFVSPAFPGYVSGHSCFSRAGAEVLSQLSGSTYFPGGSSELVFEPGYLVFEAGPSEPITLRWATYYDAADQAGASRLWGGIHVAPDDFDGRIIGSQVGLAAVELARTYFEGSATPKQPRN